MHVHTFGSKDTRRSWQRSSAQATRAQILSHGGGLTKRVFKYGLIVPGHENDEIHRISVDAATATGGGDNHMIMTDTSLHSPPSGILAPETPSRKFASEPTHMTGMLMLADSSVVLP